jgi:flagellar basal-body rod protein FlgG
MDSAGQLFESAAARGGAAPPLAQLKVVQFEPGARIQRAGDGAMRVEGTAMLALEGSYEVRQGFLENSNVSQMHEMVRLLEAVRHLETMQKVALGYDEMLGAGIRRLGEAP